MKPTKSYTRMDTKELAEATKGLADLTFEDTRPLSPENRRWWKRARRSAGPPKGGGTARAVLIRVERSLLERADRFAEREGISRSQLIAQGLKAVLAGRARPSGRARPAAGRRKIAG